MTQPDNPSSSSSSSVTCHSELRPSATSPTGAVPLRSDATTDVTETVVDKSEQRKSRGTLDEEEEEEEEEEKEEREKEEEGAACVDGEQSRSRLDTLTQKECEEKSREREEVECQKDEGDSQSKEIEEVEERGQDGEGGGSEIKEEEETEANHRHMSVVFRQELLNTVHLKVNSRIGLEISKLSDSQFDIVQLVARSLPHIVPNVLLAKREVHVDYCLWYMYIHLNCVP